MMMMKVGGGFRLQRWAMLKKAGRGRGRGLSSGASDPLLEFHRGVAAVLNRTAERLGIGHRLNVEESGGAEAVHKQKKKEGGKRPEDGSEGGGEEKKPGGRLNSALRYMTQSEIEAYADRLVTSGRLGDLEGLPRQHTAVVERFVYTHCVKILLCLMHEALDRLEGARVLGLRVSNLDQAPRAKLDLVASLQRRLDDGLESRVLVDVRSVSTFVDRVIQVERETRDATSVSTGFERVLHYNVSNIVLNLLADACSTYRFDFFGHSLRLQLQPNDLLDQVDLDALRRHRDSRRVPVFDEHLVDALADEILADKDINLWLIPDSLERSFYKRFFTFYGVLLDYALSQVRLSILDVDSSLLIHRDVSDSASSSENS